MKKNLRKDKNITITLEIGTNLRIAIVELIDAERGANVGESIKEAFGIDFTEVSGLKNTNLKKSISLKDNSLKKIKKEKFFKEIGKIIRNSTIINCNNLKK